MIKQMNIRKLILTIFLVLSLFTINFSLFTREAHAVCPVCTIAVGAGLGISRWLGIDDAVSGVWVGGIILSSSFWLLDWLVKKKIKKLFFFYKFHHKKWLCVTAH